MSLERIRPTSLLAEAEHLILTVTISLLVSVSVYSGLILREVDRNRAFLVAFALLLTIQLLAEVRQYRRIQKDTHFLEKLAFETRRLLEELTELSIILSQRREKLAGELYDLYGARRLIYLDEKKQLSEKSEKADMLERRRIPSIIAKADRQERELEGEIKDLNILLDDIEGFKERIRKLQGTSRDVIYEIMKRLRADFKRLENEIKGLNQIQKDLEARLTFYGVPAPLPLRLSER
jgi:DNA repair exonuclease SbcCD ATPase subunit